MSAARIRRLREKLNTALETGKDEDLLLAYKRLQRADETEARWPHKRGDLLRRLGRKKEAAAAFEIAAERYAQAGFVARAVAMAKVVVSLEPSRAEILERVDPKPARALHRQTRASLPPIAATAARLAPAEDADADEVRFTDAEIAVEIDLSELEEHIPSSPPSEGPSARRLAALPSFPLFAELPAEALAMVATNAELLEPAPGHVLVRRGDPADSLFAIVAGTATVEVPGLPVIRLGEGELFGESCLLSDAGRGADVLAGDELLLLRIPKNLLDEMVGSHPEVGNVLLELLTRRLLGNLLQTSHLFRAFDSGTKARLGRLFEVRRADPGTRLTESGKRTDGLYVLLTGSLRMGPAADAQLYAPGTMFGQQSLITQQPSQSDLYTGSDSLLLRLPARAFTTLAAEFPTVLAELANLAMGDEITANGLSC